MATSLQSHSCVAALDAQELLMPRHIHPVPPILGSLDQRCGACGLPDPDVRIVLRLRAAGRTRKNEGWASYHTELYCAVEDGIELQVVYRRL